MAWSTSQKARIKGFQVNTVAIPNSETSTVSLFDPELDIETGRYQLTPGGAIFFCNFICGSGNDLNIAFGFPAGILTAIVYATMHQGSNTVVQNTSTGQYLYITTTGPLDITSILGGANTFNIWSGRTDGYIVYTTSANQNTYNGGYGIGVSSPSRTCFDIEGNLWVANRGYNTVTKIGITTTREDLPAGQTSSGVDVLPWGSDSKVLLSVQLERTAGRSVVRLPGHTHPTMGTCEGLRGMGCTPEGILYVASNTNPTRIWYFDINAEPGDVPEMITIAQNLSAYGGGYNTISKKIIFTPNTGSNINTPFIVVNPYNGNSVSVPVMGTSQYLYGYGIDSLGNMYRPSTNKKVYKFDSLGNYISYGTSSRTMYSCCVYNDILYCCSADNTYIAVFNTSTMALLQEFNLGYIDHGIGGDSSNNCLWGMPYYSGDNRVFQIALNANGLVTSATCAQATLIAPWSFYNPARYPLWQDGTYVSVFATPWMVGTYTQQYGYEGGDIQAPLSGQSIILKPHRVGTGYAPVEGDSTGEILESLSDVTQVGIKVAATNAGLASATEVFYNASHVYQWDITAQFSGITAGSMAKILIRASMWTPTPGMWGWWNLYAHRTRKIGTTLHYNYSDFTGYYNTYDI
jgi:hypothetical protein